MFHRLSPMSRLFLFMNAHLSVNDVQLLLRLFRLPTNFRKHAISESKTFHNFDMSQKLVSDSITYISFAVAYFIPTVSADAIE